MNYWFIQSDVTNLRDDPALRIDRGNKQLKLKVYGSLVKVAGRKNNVLFGSCK